MSKLLVTLAAAAVIGVSVMSSNAQTVDVINHLDSPVDIGVYLGNSVGDGVSSNSQLITAKQRKQLKFDRALVENGRHYYIYIMSNEDKHFTHIFQGTDKKAQILEIAYNPNESSSVKVYVVSRSSDGHYLANCLGCVK